ncbi:hypothetical protein ACE14D_19310 [Streptomyces sp. Act-28]
MPEHFGARHAVHAPLPEVFGPARVTEDPVPIGGPSVTRSPGAAI